MTHRVTEPYREAEHMTSSITSNLRPNVLSGCAEALKDQCAEFKGFRGKLRSILRAESISLLSNQESKMAGLHANFKNTHSTYRQCWATLKSSGWKAELEKLRKSENWENSNLQLKAAYTVTDGSFKLGQKRTTHHPVRRSEQQSSGHRVLRFFEHASALCGKDRMSARHVRFMYSI